MRGNAHILKATIVLGAAGLTLAKRAFTTAVCAKGPPVPTTTSTAAAAMLTRAESDFTRANVLAASR